MVELEEGADGGRDGRAEAGLGRPEKPGQHSRGAVRREPRPAVLGTAAGAAQGRGGGGVVGAAGRWRGRGGRGAGLERVGQGGVEAHPSHLHTNVRETRAGRDRGRDGWGFNRR